MSILAIVGVIVSSAAMFVVLSGFSGLKDYSLEFISFVSPELKITSVKGKSFEFTEKIRSFLEDENISKTIEEAKVIEENSNQILDFTRKVKNLPEQDKIKIVEALWSIIYSNKDADIYETNLMRRLAGLLYIDNKTMGDIKEKVKQNSQ